MCSIQSVAACTSDLVLVNGALVTSVARTLVDIGRAESLSATVVAADFAFHERLTTGACLLRVLDECTGQPGVARARRGLKTADGRSESAGESRTRLISDQLGVALQRQVSIFDERGSFVARVDLGSSAFGLLIEFDGRTKYEKFLKADERVGDVV